MLASLSIRDIVLIEKLDLTLSDGLTVLTGETGAGKSILLDSVSLALGGRGDGALVRHGQPKGQVTLAFDLSSDHPAHAILAAADLPDEDHLVIRRIQMADGRTRAFVNEEAVSVQALRLIGASLVELHGQHADRALVDPATHRALLDAYGGLSADVVALGGLWRHWRAARETAREERVRLEAAEKEADYIRHAVEELTALGAEVGEEAALSERRSAMMRSEKIAADLSEALNAVAGGGSPIPSLSAAVRRLERRAGESQDVIRPAVEAIDQALDALELARGHLEAALADADFEPRELERIEERLFALRGAARKYAVSPDVLPEVAARFVAQLEHLDQSEARLARLDAAAMEAETAYRHAAERLSAARRAAADALDGAVGAELPPLKLERAEFLTKVTADPAAAGPEGCDGVEFWVRTNPGSRPGPMMKVASGGELARFLLALKVVLADRGSAPTLIFDEIDTGVGGAVADAIGQRLARLSQKVQVLCVTHAPQVAARAHHHLLIAKAAHPASADGAGAADGEVPVTTRVAALTPALRKEEIARMLAGASVTAEARAAAERLLKAAR
ncbi:DNA repair protein RecN [Xanthobacter agilis]|uniref:DNA repair protein RecN n=1 Tax=Xanthobacter agilis TaxID=47492 RepID=A0ABU0LDK0_XANAG|nr:DNA repair protein RecN [Xanthobacter agilis]MDQ0505184.1 DNA repair protein RecN (Recombination protein N) [Xanthobacter agilis]